MSELTERLTRARQQVAQCDHDLRCAERTLAEAEVTARVAILTTVNGDYKQLGPNESAQKLEIAYRVQRDPAVKAGQERVLNLQHAADLARVALACAIDERVERQYELDLRLVQQKERSLEVFGNLGDAT